MLLLILGIIDVVGGSIIFSSPILPDIAKYFGLILIGKGLVTIFHFIRSKIK